MEVGKIWSEVKKDFNKYIAEWLVEIDQLEDDILRTSQKIESIKAKIAEHKKALKQIPN
jgi:peptidoglycan hydrolase CwlO-like protein